jgi:hypothetical protein
MVMKQNKLRNRLAFMFPCFILKKMRDEKKARKAPNKMIREAIL